jgi:hypothetical protein
MAVILFTACGTWTVQELGPRHGRIGLYNPRTPDYQVVREELGVLGSVCGPRVQLEETPYAYARWNRSTAQIAASLGIGALWLIFGTVKPMVDELNDIGDGIGAAVAPALAGG